MTRAFQKTYLVSVLVLALGGAGCGSSSKSPSDGGGGTTGAAGTGADAAAGAGADAAAGTGADAAAGTTGTVDAAGDTGNATYSLSFAPTAPSLPAGGTRTVAVTITRGGFTGTIALTAEGGPTGLTSTFAPASVDGGTSTLTLDATDTVVAGTYSLTIKGTSGTQTAIASLSVVITAPATTLLVDHDGSENNQGTANANASASDTLFSGYLTAKATIYNTFVVSTTDNKGPTADTLKKYTTVVWYTGDKYGGDNNNTTISSSDELQLQAWLDTGGKRLVILSNEYVYGISNLAWDASDPSNTFFNTYLGGIGGEEAVRQNHLLTTVTGVGTTPLVVMVKKDDPIQTYWNAVNPATGTDTLFTISYSPNDDGTLSPIAVATGRKTAGTAATSKVVWAGFSIENILVTDKTNDLQAKTLDALFAY